MGLNNLIIAGVNKAATSSLYTYLGFHDQIATSNIKETEFFLPVRYGKKHDSLDSYNKFFDKNRTSLNTKYLMESTPGYFYGGEKLAKAIKNLIPKVKIIIILRNPVRRTESFINHCISKTWIEKKIDFNQEILNILNDLDLNNTTQIDENKYFTRSVVESFYSDLIKEWKTVFNTNIKIIYFEDLTKNPAVTLNYLYDWLELDSIKSSQTKYSTENKSITPNNILIHKTVLNIYTKFESLLRRNPNLKNLVRDFYYKFNSTKKSSLNKKVENNLVELFYLMNDIENVKLYLDEQERLGWEKYIQ
jgi:hypothetical protein